MMRLNYETMRASRANIFKRRKKIRFMKVLANNVMGILFLANYLFLIFLICFTDKDKNQILKALLGVVILSTAS